MILSDKTIRHLCTEKTPFLLDEEIGGGLAKKSIELLNGDKPLITPFINGQIREKRGEKIISYGLSSYGYDVRLADEFKIFTNVNSAVIDPLNLDTEQCFVEHKGDCCILPPNSYLLSHTIETFHVPRDILAVCVGKSTYARCGVIINVTPIEPGFEGQVVIEISNSTPLPAKIYANQGIAQFLFLAGDQPCETSYADKNGKYQGQTGITHARV